MFLGVDIGTSAVKVVVIDEACEILAQASVKLPISRPNPGWSEQNAPDWWSATNRAVSELERGLRQKIRAIGLSGQMHGATLLDADGNSLRPAILWNDGRSAPQCLALENSVEGFTSITGNRAMPGFTAPKLRWVAEHEPEIFEKTAKILLPKDYVRLRMTGEYASDLSDAAGTSWLDVAARDWSDPVLEACGLSRDHMPTLYEGPEVTGVLRPELAEAWGMDRVPVIAGGGDNAAGAIGMGVVDEGDAFLSLGTSGVLFVANNEFRPNPDGGMHTFCHALPGRWHQMSVILSAASCMEWAAQLTGHDDAGKLFAAIEMAQPDTTSMLFLPYLSGERTPHNNPAARGVLFGLDHSTGAESIGQAVLEGVAMAFRDGIDVLSDAGTHVDQLNVIGGGARSKYWGQILADALRTRLVYREGGEVGPAFGGARLALIAIEGDRGGDALSSPGIASIIEPNERSADAFERKLERFRALYSSLETHFGVTS